MAKMTRERLDELRALAEKMPAGPWTAVPWHIAEGNSQVHVPDGWLLCEVPGDSYAAFIATSRRAVPDLIAAVEELVGALESISDILEHDCDCPPCTGSDAPAEDALGIARDILSRYQEADHG